MVLKTSVCRWAVKNLHSLSQNSQPAKSEIVRKRRNVSNCRPSFLIKLSVNLCYRLFFVNTVIKFSLKFYRILLLNFSLTNDKNFENSDVLLRFFGYKVVLYLLALPIATKLFSLIFLVSSNSLFNFKIIICLAISLIRTYTKNSTICMTSTTYYQL